MHSSSQAWKFHTNGNDGYRENKPRMQEILFTASRNYKINPTAIQKPHGFEKKLHFL